MSDYGYSQLWWDPETGAEKYEGPYQCTGNCLYGSDVLMPGDAPANIMNMVAYPDPMCVMHGGHDTWEPNHYKIVNPVEPSWLADAYFHGQLTERGT